MSYHNLQKPLQTLPALLYDGVIELVEVDLARQWWYRDSSTFALQDIAKVFKITVPAADRAVAQLEARDVCRHGDEIRRVSRIRCQAMCLRVFDLYSPS